MSNTRAPSSLATSQSASTDGKLLALVRLLARQAAREACMAAREAELKEPEHARQKTPED